MPEKLKSSLAKLRKKAVTRLRRAHERGAAAHDKLNQELEIQKIELILQNEELRSSQEDLLESQLHYTELYDFAPVAYFTLDLKHHILQANLRAGELLATERSFLKGRLFTSFISFHHRIEFEKFMSGIEETKNQQECELELDARDMRKQVPIRRWGHLVGALIEGAGVRPAHFLISVTDVTRRKQAEQGLWEIRRELEDRVAQRTQELGDVNEKLKRKVEESEAIARELRQSKQALEAKHEELRELTRQLIDVQDAERRRISRELHDDLNQKLAVLVMDTQQIQRSVVADSPVAQAMVALRSRLVNLSQNVHLLAYQLHPSILDDLHLPLALQSFADEWATRERVTVRFVHKNLPKSIPNDVASCLYRVTQESLHNISKHASGSPVNIRLEGSNRMIRLSIRDRGPGLKTSAGNLKLQGLGILGMQERVRLVNGTLSIQSKPGLGTTVLARVPIASCHAEGAS